MIYLKDNCNNCALPQHNYFTLYFIYFFWILFFIFLTLQYCIGFAIHQHESATGIHVWCLIFHLATLSDEIIRSLVLNIMNLRSLLTTPGEIVVGCLIYEYRDA